MLILSRSNLITCVSRSRQDPSFNNAGSACPIELLLFLILLSKLPPSTFTWAQKREVLDLLKELKSERVEVEMINWGLKYPGGRYAFREEYLKELESN